MSTNWINPALGELTCRMMDDQGVHVCDTLIKKVHRALSYNSAKTVKSVLLGMCGYAMRHKAMKTNPARSVDRLSSKSEDAEDEILVLDLAQRRDIDTKLRALAEAKQVDAKGRSLGQRGAVWLMLPDLQEGMLATGARIGELLAVHGDDIDVKNRTVWIGYHLVREAGKGLVRKKHRKGGKPGVLATMPEWSVPMWTRLKLASGGGPIMPSARGRGQYSDPSNVINRLDAAFEEIGYGWVTSHIWRHTMATVLIEAGLSIEDAADALGNTPAVLEKYYRAKRKANPAIASALDSLMWTEPQPPPDEAAELEGTSSNPPG